jgi:hypothetical protein
MKRVGDDTADAPTIRVEGPLVERRSTAALRQVRRA